MTNREIKEGEYHIVRDSRPTSYPFDVMRRIGGRDHRINSFGTEIHARYFAAAQMVAKPYKCPRCGQDFETKEASEGAAEACRDPSCPLT